MLENIWSELSYNQKKELGKYALVFCGGVATGLIIKKTVESILGDVSEDILQKEDNEENHVTIIDSVDEILLDEDIKLDIND